MMMKVRNLRNARDCESIYYKADNHEGHEEHEVSI